MTTYQFNYQQLMELCESIRELAVWNDMDYAGERISDDYVYLKVDVDSDTCVISTKHHTVSHRYTEAIGIKEER